MRDLGGIGVPVLEKIRDKIMRTARLGPWEIYMIY
jgi:hypothetical protein